ncbi:MAG: hypothetical protein ACI3YD_02190 [Alloprevotella sp.]
MNLLSALHYRYPRALSLLTVPGLIALIACHNKSNGQSDSLDNCSEARARMEQEAVGRLQTARRQLAAHQYAAARQTVNKMRKDCYLALNAREKAILLMDSIDWMAAQDELANIDSLMRCQPDSVGQADFDEACRKVQFYERKLQHDRKTKP